MSADRFAVRGVWRSVLCCICAVVLVGCSTATVSQRKLPVAVELLNASQRYELVYLIQAGDQLDVFLNKHGEYSRKVAVRSDGYISLPLINEVKVVGMTPLDLSEDLRKRFGVRLKDPEVQVGVLNPPEPMVYVVGQAGQPRALPLRQAATVAQALAQSGDATRAAALGDLSVIRLNSAGYLESLMLTLPQDGPVSQPDLYMAMSALTLKPNDIVLLPESARSQVLRLLQDVSVAMTPLFNVLVIRKLYE